MSTRDYFNEAVRWDEYDRGLREDNRHVPANAEYFDGVFQGCLACQTELNAGTLLYRGRIMPPEKETDTDPLPFWSMGMPPAQVTRDQRLSPAGIPMFYGALDVDSVIAELRPWPQARVTVAAFRTAGPFNVLDLRQANPRVFNTPHLSYVAHMISRPVHLDDTMRYLGAREATRRLHQR